MPSGRTCWFCWFTQQSLEETIRGSTLQGSPLKRKSSLFFYVQYEGRKCCRKKEIQRLIPPRRVERIPSRHKIQTCSVLVMEELLFQIIAVTVAALSIGVIYWYIYYDAVCADKVYPPNFNQEELHRDRESDTDSANSGLCYGSVSEDPREPQQSHRPSKTLHK